MGVMSRRVLPVCGSLCFFCPSMRARSRQPVKRYKKLLADIFPRSQDAEPNDRKNGKLCEYASKNPLRIPKITCYLEQRFYKDLRNEHSGSVKVVVCLYRKLLSSCKEQMPLFASSFLGITRTVLEQTRQPEMQILACTSIVDFINSQTDGTYMFNLEGLIPKLCQLAQEVGDDDRALRLRSAGLQALASMVWFMGEHSHISMDFDNIISVTLDNYMDLPINLENGRLEAGHDGSSFPDISRSVSSVSRLELDSTTDVSRNPSYWSRICLYNMARLAKEATTVRRVFDPLFHSFDAEDHWSSEKGLACSVLTYMQLLLEDSGLNSHLLLSVLVKYLDNKNIAKWPLKQLNIVNVIAQLALNAKPGASVVIVGAISDLMKHLRKCIQCSAEATSPRESMDKLNTDLQSALEKCILQLTEKVGDVGPIVDMMAMGLENIPINATAARSTIFSAYRTAEVISCIPNLSYHKKAFPDALFHQLLFAMSHPDHKTRVGAHHIFSIVLMPSAICPWLIRNGWSPLPPVASEGINSSSFRVQDESNDKPNSMDIVVTGKTNQLLDNVVTQSNECLSGGQSSSFKHGGQSSSFKHAMVNGKSEPTSLRLSSRQLSLLLSAIWMQAASRENVPENFEAMAHTYSLALVFARYKNSSHMALVRCFQLAFSLRSISLNQEGGLQPSRRRSLFTMASCMLIFSARAGNLPELIPLVKSSLTNGTVDPYLKLVEDTRLLAVCSDEEEGYGSPKDEIVASNCFSTVELGDKELREVVISQFMSKFRKLSEDELSGMRMQLLQEFSPDDEYLLGAPLFMETPHPCSPLAQMESEAFDEVMPLDAVIDEEAFPEPNGSQSGRMTSLSINSLDIKSVNQLLDSVLETARQVASLPVSSTPIPYDQVKDQCEALVMGKQKKMSVLQSFKLQQEVKALTFPNAREDESNCLPNGTIELLEGDPTLMESEQGQGLDKLLVCSLEHGQHQQQSFRLPPSSPYDKFLKAAGC